MSDTPPPEDGASRPDGVSRPNISLFADAPPVPPPASAAESPPLTPNPPPVSSPPNPQVKGRGWFGFVMLCIGAGLGTWGGMMIESVPPSPAPQETSGRLEAIAPPPAASDSNETAPAQTANPTWPAAFYADMARTYHRYKGYEKAEPLWRKAIALASEKPAQQAHFQMGLGETLLRLNRVEEGRTHFKTALEQAADKRTKDGFYQRIARAYDAAKQYDEADTTVQILMAETTNKGSLNRYHNWRMDIARRAGKLPAAIEEWQEKLDENPDDIDALKALIRIQWDFQRNGTEAAPLYERLATLTKDVEQKGKILNRAGEAHRRAKEYEAAIKPLQQAIALLPDKTAQAPTYWQLVDVYRRLKKNPELESALQFVAAHSKANGYRERGVRDLMNFYRRTKQPEKMRAVVAAYEKKLSENPDDTEALERLGDIRNQIYRKPQTALPYLEKLLALQPETLNAMRKLADTQAALKNYPEAIRLYEAMSEKVEKRRKGWYYGRLSQYHRQAGDAEQSVTWGEKAAALSPKNAWSVANLANVYAANQLPNKAAEEWAKAIKLATRDRDRENIQRRAAGFHRNQENFAKAIALLEAVIDTSKNKRTIKDATRELAEVKKRQAAAEDVANEEDEEGIEDE